MTAQVEMKLGDSEIKVMNVIWRLGEPTARQVAEILQAEVGWNVNTTYTLIKRCIEKQALERLEPGFLCRALVTKQEAQSLETRELIDKLYDGSADRLVASILGKPDLPAEEIGRLRKLVEEWEE